MNSWDSRLIASFLIFVAGAYTMALYRGEGGHVAFAIAAGILVALAIANLVRPPKR